MKLVSPALLATLGLAFAPSPMDATPGDLDPTFDPDSSVNYAVLALTTQSDGKVFVAGAFTSIQGIFRGGIARLNTNGLLDTSFLNGLPGANNYVWAVALQTDGKPLIGGFFTTVNGTARNCVARLNSDGSLDNSFLNSQTGANGAVYSVALQTDGKVLIAGNFTSVNGTNRNCIARLNTDGSLDSSFLNGLDGLDAAAFCISLQGDGKILIGGWFTSVNGVGRNFVARLNTDGSLDTNFLNNLAGADGRVWSIALQTDGKILIGGDFISMNGAIRNHLARLNTNGSLDSFSTSVGVDDSIWSLAVQSDGKILIGGQFTSVLAIQRSSLARLNPDGLLDTSFLSGLAGPNGTVRSLTLQSNGKVLIGGQFTAVNLTPRSYVARLSGAFGAPRLDNGRIVNGLFTFNLSGDPGRTVIIQVSTNLQSWSPIATNVLSATPTTFSDLQSAGLVKRFYRLLEL